MIVVCDTSPLCYLALIDHLDLLPTLFSRVLVPSTVLDELQHELSPPVVRTLGSQPPGWLEVRPVPPHTDPSLSTLDDGERDAILLAEEVAADLIVLDERKARLLAKERGLKVTGLLGILKSAARRDKVDLGSAVDRLRQTTFHLSDSLVQWLSEPGGNEL
jgi:predicted nucleic acid-binding protein